MNNWIETYTHKKFDIFNPRMEDIFIADIAHSLSNQCRFTGHGKSFFSIAQHSMMVSACCTNQLLGLLHDAQEAYLSDVPRPIKLHPSFKFYRDIEDNLQAMILDKFEVSFTEKDWEELCITDSIICLIEAEHLGFDIKNWVNYITVDPIPSFYCMGPLEAEERFLKKFYKLIG